MDAVLAEGARRDARCYSTRCRRRRRAGQGRAGANQKLGRTRTNTVYPSSKVPDHSGDIHLYPLFSFHHLTTKIRYVMIM